MMLKSETGGLHMPRGWSGMTLVEIMVVVGAITLLLGMVLGGLNVARAEARRVTCARNLGQIGQLTALYAAENGGRVVPYGDHDPATDSRTMDMWYVNLIALTIDRQHIAHPSDPNLVNWERPPAEAETFLCPDHAGRFRHDHAGRFGFNRDDISYGLNADVKDADGNPYTSGSTANGVPDVYYFDEMVNPADFILVADSGYDARSDVTGQNRDFRSWIASPQLAGGRPASPMHRGKANVLFGDLRVESREARLDVLGINTARAEIARSWVLGNR